MKKAEFGKIHNLKTEQDRMNYFRQNLYIGQKPVSMHSCLVCDEIIGMPSQHKCKIKMEP